MSLPLEIVPPPALTEVLNELALLASHEAAYRQAYVAVRRATWALGRGEEAKALQELLKAAAALRRLTTPEAAEVRLVVAEILREVVHASMQP